jgi:hypothetical protein
MPITTEKVDDLPVVISTYSGHITSEEVEVMYQDTERLLSDAGDKYYRISDVTHAETSFPDFIKITTAMTSGRKYGTGDPNLQVVFVGTNQWMYNIRNLAQQKGIRLPNFDSLDKAMGYIRLDMSGNFENQTP